MPTSGETSRAYTLRIKGRINGDNPQGTSWRDALWQTHEAVNKGAKVFGDWLLTLRGGLDHTLADAKVSQGKGKPGRDPTDEERKTRRILLALSWLSVESKRGAPQDYFIATGEETVEARNKKVLAALEEILKSRGLNESEIAAWKNDCAASLSAAIRNDAVWVNRSKAFDDAVKKFNDAGESACQSSMREEIWDMMEPFFGDCNGYLTLAISAADESFSAEQDAKDLVQKAGQWLSSRFGTGQGADFSRMGQVYRRINEWAGRAQEGTTGNEAIKSLAKALGEFGPRSEDLEGVLGLISGPGYKSATRNHLQEIDRKTTITQQDIKSLEEKAIRDVEKCCKREGSKGRRPYADAILQDLEKSCGLTYRTDKDGNSVPVADYSKYDKWGPARHEEFAVMLDHAARRVSSAYTWIKRAEAERKRFDNDAKLIEQVPENVKKWLDDFCSERSQASGALTSYRIRRGAVGGWEKVLTKWLEPDCKTKEDRVAAARELQDDPEIEKFGDIQLFEALAEDDAACVWHKDGDVAKDPDHQPLMNYVIASEADYKKRQFKVPAYRHPDALLHPVFCDFGTSRWGISFDIHKKEQTQNPRAFHLKLWTRSKIEQVDLVWQSKKLARDLALGQHAPKERGFKVTRADRLGRAVANAGKNDEVEIEGLFEQDNWNGRLQAPRHQLEAIARHVEKYGWDHTALKKRDRIQWLLTFSARLKPRGPWNEFAEKHHLKPDPRYWPHAETNKKRRPQARLILCRLPGLRVLSVDLGHRYAAACAVWETLSAEQVREACAAAGHKTLEKNDLYLHLKKKVTKQKKGKPVEIEETTVYRRIGADAIKAVDEGTGNVKTVPHPAPWARLDRQFLIKLQGEEEGAREASNKEIWEVHKLEKELGRTVPLIDRLVAAGWGSSDQQQARLEALKQLGWIPAKEEKTEGDGSGKDNEEEDFFKPSRAVNDLMFSAVRTMRLALRRHGDEARIAYYFIADEKAKPGGIKEALDEAGRVERLQDALALWHGLFSSRGWQDDEAKRLWEEHIAKLSGYEPPEKIGNEDSGSKHKEKKEKNREKLYPVAKALAQDLNLRQALHNVWKKRWEKNDEQWKKHLRWFTRWVLPRGKQAGDPVIRKVGGLSLTRLATLTEFRRKVQVGFFTRFHPNGTKDEIKEYFGQRALETLEHIREQRVKQLASRIVEAALGVGSESQKHWDRGKRPSVRIDDPRFAPCHAVVVENLTNYRPEETRTRRENRQLMAWSSSKVKKYLAEECQLHGLHFREISAGYTSRQDSRTGAPGIRCRDVPVTEFMRSPFWRKQVAQAEKKQAENKADARERFLCSLNTIWKDKAAADWKKAGHVRVPLNGGEIFVSADPASPSSKGIQADLNAAANIGLRALTDPDWPGKWWYIPCDSASFKPSDKKVAGSAAVNLDKPLWQSAKTRNDDAPKDGKKSGKREAGKSKDTINLWRDVSADPVEEGDWKEYAEYQNEVQRRVVTILQKQKGTRDQQPQHVPADDDISF